MDTTDAQIMRQLFHPPPDGHQFDVRVTYADIARRVGVDEETVRQRVRRLEQVGFLKRWRVNVNPALFDRAMVRLEVPPVGLPEREKVRAALATFEGAHLLFEYHSGALALVALLPPGPGMDRVVRLASAVAGRPVGATTLRLPPATVEPTPFDWRLIQALRRDPRQPYAGLAADLGVSERTVRRRLEALIDARVLFLDTVVDASRVEGGVAATVFVDHEGGPVAAEVDAELRALPGLIFFASFPTGARASFFAPSLGDLAALEQRLRALPGVRVGSDFQVERRGLDEWTDEQIARRAGPA